MQSGDATPIALAANIEKRPRDMRAKSALSLSFANTETTEPPTIPAAQKGAIPQKTIQKWRQKYMISFSMPLSPFARASAVTLYLLGARLKSSGAKDSSRLAS